jgi:hypothetical protein
VATGPFTENPAIDFDDAPLYNLGSAPIAAIGLAVSPDTGVLAISVTYGNTTAPPRGSTSTSAPLTSITLDPAVEWVTAAYISSRAATLTSLALVTNRGRTLGGAAGFVVAEDNAVVTAHPCPAGAYKLAYIKGRSGAPEVATATAVGALQELVLVWAPVRAPASASSGSAATARRLAGHSPEAGPDEPQRITPAPTHPVVEVRRPGRKLHHTVSNGSNPIYEDEDTRVVFVGSYRRAARPGIMVAGVAQAEPCSDRPARVTATGPYSTGAPGAAITGYHNGWHTLQRLSGQPMDVVPDITSISIASDRPNQVRSMGWAADA